MMSQQGSLSTRSEQLARAHCCMSQHCKAAEQRLLGRSTSRRCNSCTLSGRTYLGTYRLGRARNLQYHCPKNKSLAGMRCTPQGRSCPESGWPCPLGTPCTLWNCLRQSRYCMCPQDIAQKSDSRSPRRPSRKNRRMGMRCSCFHPFGRCRSRQRKKCTKRHPDWGCARRASTGSKGRSH